MNKTKEEKEQFSKAISTAQKGSWWMTNDGIIIKYVVPNKQKTFLDNGYYRCDRSGKPYKEYIKKTCEELKEIHIKRGKEYGKQQIGSIFMTNGIDKPKRIFINKQPEYIANGYYRCKGPKNMTPYNQKVV